MTVRFPIEIGSPYTFLTVALASNLSPMFLKISGTLMTSLSASTQDLMSPKVKECR